MQQPSWLWDSTAETIAQIPFGMQLKQQGQSSGFCRAFQTLRLIQAPSDHHLAQV